MLARGPATTTVAAPRSLDGGFYVLTAPQVEPYVAFRQMFRDLEKQFKWRSYPPTR
jgi:hypothetical protein